VNKKAGGKNLPTRLGACPCLATQRYLAKKGCSKCLRLYAASVMDQSSKIAAGAAVY